MGKGTFLDTFKKSIFPFIYFPSLQNIAFSNFNIFLGVLTLSRRHHHRWFCLYHLETSPAYWATGIISQTNLVHSGTLYNMVSLSLSVTINQLVKSDSQIVKITPLKGRNLENTQTQLVIDRRRTILDTIYSDLLVLLYYISFWEHKYSYLHSWSIFLSISLSLVPSRLVQGFLPRPSLNSWEISS